MTSLSHRRRGAVRWLVVLAVLAVGCGEADRSAPDYTAYRQFMEAERLDLEVFEDPALVATATRAAQLEALASGRRVECVAPGGATRGALRMVVGLPDSVGVPALLERLGATVDSDGFHLRGVPEGLVADALVATLADPRRGAPVTLVCALDAKQLEALVRPPAGSVRPAWRAGLRAWRAGDLILEARLSQDGVVREIELLADRRAELAGGERLEDSGLVIHVAPGTPQRELLSWRRANVAARRRVSAWLGGSRAGTPVSLEAQTYAHPEDLRRLTRASGLSSLNPVTGAVQALAAPGLPHDDGFAVARALALQLAGPPAHEWMLDGVAAAAVSNWWGRPKGLWVAFLTEGRLFHDLGALLDPLADDSPHVLVPLRGVLFEFLVDRHGAQAVADIWRGERELALDAEFTAAFLELLESKRARRAEHLGTAREERLSAILGRPERRRGANLLAPPEPGYGLGFGTRACERSLDDLAALGANSVGLAFRGAVQTGPRDFALGPAASPLGFLVSDLELVATTSAARARGLSTMFKPELLARASGIRTGDTAAESSQDAERFFLDSRRYLVHAALVAELSGAEVFCLATELPHTAVTANPDIPEFMRQNQQAWDDLITALRAAFTGALTYAADWRSEVDGIEFWPGLDFVGVTLFPSLGLGLVPERPDDRQAEQRLLSALRTLVGAADERYMPVLICEVGFPSSSRAWDQPEASLGTPDLDEQTRLYGVLARVFRDQYLTREMFEGLYLWSWSTDPDAGRELDRGFTPQNRSARAHAAQLFEDL